MFAPNRTLVAAMRNTEQVHITLSVALLVACAANLALVCAWL